MQTENLDPCPILNGFYVFHRDNIRKTLTIMHNPVFEHLDKLSFALLACVVLHISGFFTFVQYIIILTHLDSCIKVS